METQEGCIRLGDLPKTEQRIVEAYLPLIREIFAIAPTNGDDNSTDIEFNGDLKRFLEMFVAIFRTTSTNTTTLPLPKNVQPNDGDEENDKFLAQRMQRFRDVYRRQYRNVYFMSSSRLEEIRQLAEAAAVYSVPADNEMLSRLKELINMEGMWVQRINACKRVKIIDSIQIDTISAFRSEVESEFSLLYGDSKIDFYEEEWFKGHLKKMLDDVKHDFEGQIPCGTEEDSALMLEVTSAFEKEVKENIVANLIKRNTDNIKNVKVVMKAAVDRSVASYTEEMTTILESISPGERIPFLDYHTKTKGNCAPTYPDKITKQNSGALDLEVEFTNQYEQRVHDSFHKIMEVGGDKTRQMLNQLMETGKSQLDGFIQNYQKVFEGCGVPQKHIIQLQDRMEKVLVGVLEEVKEGSLADVMSVDLLVHESTPKKLLTSTEQRERDEKINEALDKFKRQYEEKIDYNVRYAARNFEEAKRYHDDVIKDLTKEIKTHLIDKFDVESDEAYISKFRVFAEENWNKRKLHDYYFQENYISTSEESEC